MGRRHWRGPHAAKVIGLQGVWRGYASLAGAPCPVSDVGARISGLGARSSDPGSRILDLGSRTGAAGVALASILFFLEFSFMV